MIANNINGRIKTFNSIPKVFELKPNVMNYNRLDADVHYKDGFRELINPTLEENQYKTDLFFDVEKDYFTFHVETYTDEEIKQQKIDKEFNLYQQRQNKGLNLYLEHEAEYRIMYLNDVITKEEFNIIEDALKPVRLELGFGQLKTAKEILKDIPESRIGVEIYNTFYSDLDKLINELYVN
jgi:hypothetical protein